MSACECCGAGGAVKSVWEEMLCPTCMTRMAIDNAASDHLRMLLRETLNTWADAWQHHPRILLTIDEEARFMVTETMNEIRDERGAARKNLKLKKTA